MRWATVCESAWCSPRQSSVATRQRCVPTASAATTDAQQPNTVAVPSVKAHPAPEAQPGWYWHHGVHHLADLQPSYTR